MRKSSKAKDMHDPSDYIITLPKEGGFKVFSPVNPSHALVECSTLGRLLHCHNFKHSSLFLCVFEDNRFDLAVWDQSRSRFEAKISMKTVIHHMKVCGDWVVLVTG